MKKRFLLALIAVSMSLAGCGKKDNDSSDEPTEVIPEGGGEGGEGGGGGGEEDTLTPEQRSNATTIKSTLDLAIAMAAQDSEVTRACDEYTLKYAEEVAIEDVSFDKVSAHIDDITPIIEEPTAEAVIDLLEETKEDGSLKDIVYIAVAAGKSLLRAYSFKDEKLGDVYEFAADYLDDEEITLHENVYGLVEASVDCVSFYTSDEFVELSEKVFDKENHKVNFAALAQLLVKVSESLTYVEKATGHAEYLLGLVSSCAVSYVLKWYSVIGPEVEKVGEVVKGVFEQLSSEEIKTLFEEFKAAESDEVALAKVKAIILAVADAIEGLLEAEESAEVLLGYALDFAKLVLSLSGSSDEEIEEMFEGVSAEEISEFVFGRISSLVDYLKEIGQGETESSDLVEAIKVIIEELSKEEPNPLNLLYAVVDAIAAILYGKFEITSMTQSDFSDSLKGLVMSLGVVVLMLTNGLPAWINDCFVTDEVTGVTTISEEGLNTLASCLQPVVSVLASFCEYVVSPIGVIEEVVEQVSKQEEPVFEKIYASLASIKSSLDGVVEFLGSDALADLYIPSIVKYGNLILEAIDLVKDFSEDYVVEDYKVVSVVTEVVSLFVEPSVEHLEYEQDTTEGVDERVLEAVNIEIEEDVSEVSGHGYAISEIYENEEVYYVDVTLVSEYNYVVSEGVITSFSATADVMTFEVSELLVDLLARVQPLVSALTLA